MSQRMDVCFSFLSPSERSLGWLFPTISSAPAGFPLSFLPSWWSTQMPSSKLKLEEISVYYIWQIKRMVVYQWLSGKLKTYLSLNPDTLRFIGHATLIFFLSFKILIFVVHVISEPPCFHFQSQYNNISSCATGWVSGIKYGDPWESLTHHRC